MSVFCTVKAQSRKGKYLQTTSKVDVSLFLPLLKTSIFKNNNYINTVLY